MKRSTRLVNSALGIMGIATLASISYRLLAHEKVSAQVMNPVTYTAVLKQTTLDGDGRPKPSMVITWAVRSDGSQAIKFEAAHLHERTIDMASGERILIDDAHQMKSTTVYKTWTADHWLRDTSKGCLTAEEQSAHLAIDGIVADTVAGYRTMKITRANMASWYALDYGCAMIRSTADWGDGSKAEERLVSLTYGEPDASLFATSQEFQEATPSQIACSFASDLEGKNCGTSTQPASAMDAQYYAHRPT